MPRISVILTSYNHEKYIAKAIDSVLNQTFVDFELIILDDASTDGSWGIIESYSDHRIKAIRNKINQGSAVGILDVIETVSEGHYIAMHHSDDEWTLDKLQKQVQFLDERPFVGAVFSLVQIIDENDKRLDSNWFEHGNRSRAEWLNLLFNEKNYLAHPSVLIRKEVFSSVGVYKRYLLQTPDAEMWSRVLLKFDIHVVQERLTLHRVFSDFSNTSGKRVDVAIRAANEWNVLRKNFLVITDQDFVFEIFPGIERYRRAEGFSIKFLLAMACLFDTKHQNAWGFGLSLLYEIMDSEVELSNVSRLYDFHEQDFIKLTSLFDVYGLATSGWVSQVQEAKEWFEGQLAVAQVELNELQHNLSTLSLERDKIYQSSSWRVTRPLRFVVSVGRSLGQIVRQFIGISSGLLSAQRINSALRLLIRGDLIGFQSALYSVMRREVKRSIRVKALESICPCPLDNGQPLVSVIIPCFNYGKFVVGAIDSVLAQTLINVEVIVVDGGSTDSDTLEILKNTQRPGTRILLRDGRHLVGDNRNYGIELARGRYICCLDADDTLDATYLEKAVFFLETYGYDIVSTAINYVGAREGQVDIMECPDLTDMVNGNHVLTCAVFRRELWKRVGGYVDVGIGKHHVAEDWDFWLRLTASGARIRNITGEYLFNYRIHEGGSLSSSADVKSLSEQKSAILDRNRELLSRKTYKFSEDQQSRRLRSEPTQTALASCFDIDSHRMTLLLAMPYFLVGGAERLLSGLCEYLARHGWRVIVIATLPQDKGHGASIDWFTASTSEVYSLPRFLEPEEQTDFVAYLLASRRVDCLLNTGSRLVYELLPSLLKGNSNLSVVDFLFNTVGHVESHLEFKEFVSFAIAENQEVFDWYMNVARWPVERLAIVSSGVNLKRLSPGPRPEPLIEKYRIEAADLVIGFSGRFSEEKGPDVFLEVANLCRECKNVVFVMTGAGPLTESISKKVQALPATVRFEFAGLVDDVDQYLGLYDVLILPSRFDGRPLVVMEALACGVPVIASDVGGLPDLVSNGLNGYLVPPADAQAIADCIVRLAENRPLLATLKEGARRMAEERLDANLAYRDFEASLRMAIDTHKVVN